MLRIDLSPRLKQATKISPVMRIEQSLLALPINDLKAAVKAELDSNPALSGSSPMVVPPMLRLASGGYVLDNAKAKGKTLVEHLLGELRMSGVSGREAELCEAVVCELDESGIFRGEVPSMAMALGATEAEIDAARRRIMTIDPRGCGAKDMFECMLAQLGVVPKEKREAVAAAIAKLRDGTISAEEKAMLRPYAMKMNVAPGKAYAYVRVNYVTPDVTVDADGDFEIDGGDIPELTVSRKYIEMASDRELDEETRAYAAEKVQRARDFNAALQRRREALERIVAEVLANQRDFLKVGKSALHRLTESEVAAKLAQAGTPCSVSTVSRAASRKFVKTPHGVVPLRSFFALNESAPLEKLREILAAVPAGGRISDREASERMKAAGYDVKRRTIANWRKKL